MRILILSILGFCLIAGKAIASDKYIAPNGSDVTGDGSIGNPYQSINFASSIWRPNPLGPGDTLFLIFRRC